MRYLWLVVLFLLSFSAEGQRGKKKPSLKGLDTHCAYQGSYSTMQLRALFPFNSSTTVLAISHQTGIDVIRSTLDTLGYKWVKEMRQLSQEQTDSLASLLNNYSYKNLVQGVKVEGGSPNCFNPRNAFVFLDNEGNKVASIDLCFECEGHVCTPNTFSIGDMCDERYDLLKQLLINIGIEYGTVIKR